MKPLLPLLFLCLLSATPTAPPPHLSLARQVVDSIDPADNTYAHKDCYLRKSGTHYHNRTDCSAFLNLLLEQSYGTTPENLLQWTGHRRPTARAWHQTILDHKRFKQIEKVSDIQPGDILAIAYPKDEQEDTGHIMIDVEPPKPAASAKPLIPDTRQWTLSIIDSSKSGHGRTDTRHHSDGSFSQGVGQGTLHLYTHPNGQIAGYTWSTFPNSTYRPQSEHPLAIGRLERE
jgi:hypothetical protein